MRTSPITISDNTIRRLSKYLRKLQELESEGVQKTSSFELGTLLGHTASQVRQDFSCFGEFGQQGYGYNVTLLRKSIEEILGVNSGLTAILIGVGNIGKALLANFPFEECGVRLLAAYDADPKLVGSSVHGMKVQNRAALDKRLKHELPDIAILCVSQNEAVSAAKYLAERGIQAIWNYTNREILPPDSHVMVENVHFTDSLHTLCYYVTKEKKQSKKQN